MIYSRIKLTILIFLLIMYSPLSLADLVLIVNPASGITSISKNEAKRVFLGKMKKVKGKSLIAVDQKEGNASRIAFYKNVVRKSESQLKSYWSTRIFSGKGTPPKSFENDDDVKRWISENPNAIGYLDSNKVDSTVVVIYSE